MGITVTFRHMEPLESLKTYAEEKASKVKKFMDSPIDAHIVLSVEKFRHIADATFNIDGARIKAIEETGDMYSAIDQVMDKIENQVKKHLSRIRDYRAETLRESAPGLEEEMDISGEGPIIHVEKLDAKPMDTEEAAMQLQLKDQGFLVFRNARTLEVNVIYKRGDGNLGLIEPTLS